METNNQTVREITVIIIDDNDQTRTRFAELLERINFRIVWKQEIKEAIAYIMQNKPDVILLNAKHSQFNSYALAQKIKNNETIRNISLIMIEANSERLDGHPEIQKCVDEFIHPEASEAEVLKRVQTSVSLMGLRTKSLNFEERVKQEVTKQIQLLQAPQENKQSHARDIIHRLCMVAEYKDEDPAPHIYRIMNISSIIAKKLGYNDEDVERISFASLLHDIGKIGIPDHILVKKGPLNGAERRVIEQHTNIGSRILSGVHDPVLKTAAVIALSHHERWDGHGYPKKLKGTDIPIEGRIIGLADAFDIITSNKNYKTALPLDRAFSMVKSAKRKQFDPDLVDVFLKLKDEVTQIKEKYKDYGESLLITHYNQMKD